MKKYDIFCRSLSLIIAACIVGATFVFDPDPSKLAETWMVATTMSFAGMMLSMGLFYVGTMDEPTPYKGREADIAEEQWKRRFALVIVCNSATTLLILGIGMHLFG